MKILVWGEDLHFLPRETVYINNSVTKNFHSFISQYVSAKTKQCSNYTVWYPNQSMTCLLEVFSKTESGQQVYLYMYMI